MHVFGNFLLAAMFNKCNIMMFLVWAHTEASEGFVKQILLGPSEIIGSTFQLIDGPTQRLWKVPVKQILGPSKIIGNIY